MGVLWFLTAPTSPKWRLDPAAIEVALKVSWPDTVEIRRESGSSPTLVWTDTRAKDGQWLEGRLSIGQPDSIAFKGWPELIVDHALLLSRLVGDDSPAVLANDSGEIFDLRGSPDRDALLAAIDEVSGIDQRRSAAAGVKHQLIAAIREASALLRETGWPDRAAWLEDQALRMTVPAPDSPEYVAEVARLRGVLVGMGSLSDLPLTPGPGSPLSRREANDRLWGLVERIGRLSGPSSPAS